MYNIYHFLKDICGMKYIVCEKTLLYDVKHYYDWIVSYDVLNNILTNYNNIINLFWKELKPYSKRTTPSKPNDEFIIKYIYPKQELFASNIIKIDMQRAFTTYAEQVLDADALALYTKMCTILASSSYLPKRAKKFLYNYFLTNIIIHCMGIDTLYKLRYMVYDDVLYVAERIGDIIKSEVDGAYIKPYKMRILNDIYDIYGQISTTVYKWVLFKQKYMIGVINKNNQVTFKGFDSLSPNIFYSLISRLCLATSERDMDYIIDTFLFNNTDSLLDFAYKTTDGSSIKLKLKNMTAIINSDDIDLSSYNDMHNRIDFAYYVNEIYPILSSIFSNITI